MNRRTVLQMGVAAAALPAVIPAQERPHSEQVSERPDAAGWKPQVFDDHQNQTVIALTDLIIPATDTPGAKAANVNRYIDLFLADGPDSERGRFIEGLAWLDALAIQQHERTFVKCAPDQQVAMLTALESGSGTGHEFFRMAKSMTATVYYKTQIGFHELNKGGRVPGSFGCKHPEHA
ncbi:MAG TPA: gluconate 2-dehydrogenase subunit 3 family protein [Bryobacteraceae bacterium]|nr:gluconate 2-dehydrogenase subunit 3 family protein [Bryobacteraceae bacterium]